MVEIHKWKDLKDDFKEGLVLGNGASIAVSDKFRYPSLYEAAKAGRFLSEPSQAVFASFKSTDFELVLRRLWQASLVNQALKIDGIQVSDAYKEVRSSLIHTVRAIHPAYSDVQQHFEAMDVWLRGFRTVATLNYDVLLYWATLASNAKRNSHWFKDAFIKADGKLMFREDWETVRQPYGNASGATLFCYPHGNLCLGADADGGEVKIGAGAENLLDSITDRWERGLEAPLFVSEGTMQQKLAAIHRSSYLSRIFFEVLGTLGASVTFYGLSFSHQDTHLVRRIGRYTPKVAVSVYRGNTADITNAMGMLKASGIHDIRFFDAESVGAWIYT